MEISRAGGGKAAGGKDKTIALGSSAKVRQFLEGSVGRRGIHVRGRTAHLGIDYGMGSIGQKKVGLRSQIQKVKRLMPTVLRLGATGGPHVYSAGIMAAVKYG